MYKEILNKLSPEMDKIIEYLKNELNKMRVGRANPAMIEDIQISCYNQIFPLKQLANISVPEPRIIIIQPWDKSITEDIIRGISQASSGLSAVADKEIIRINIPPLNEERRKELIKILHEKVEETKISIRMHREKTWKDIQDKEKSGDIREDEKFRSKEELQKLIDNYNEKVEEMKKNKEEEILTI